MAPQTNAWRQQRPRQHQPKGPAASKHLLSNLQSFFIHSAPVVPVQVAEEPLATPSSSFFALRDLWAAYDEWSAYGAEIPMRVHLDGTWQEIVQCYVPYLSGLQLFGADHTRRIPVPSSGYSSDEEATSSSGVYSCSDSGCSSVCTSSTASTASVDSDSEADSKDGNSPSSGAAGDDRKAAFRIGARDRGSVLQKQHCAGEPGKLLFQFFEEESPYARCPLSDRVAELAEEFPSLLSLSSTDLHPASWFAVAWYPIYRIPSLADPALSRDLQASLLTFHSLAVPPSLPAELQMRSSAAPIPPAPTAPAAAALAWRAETARQQLLASALSSLAVEEGVGSSPAAVGEAAEDCCQQGGATTPCVSVACLRPFAFMPYKVVGRTWTDDFNLRSQHLPMISAAGMWLERRKVRLPDFEFFSRNFRPLPVCR